jgi:hypothetical protein
MRILISIVFTLLLFCKSVAGGPKTDSANVNDPQGIYLACGSSFSGIDIYRNYLENPHRFGINPRLYYEFSNTLRLGGGFTRISRFTFAPSWQRLGSYVAELDLHMMARIKEERSIFYIITGVCFNKWKGHFLQQSAYYDAVAGYEPNTTISNSWLGLNAGVGVERAFRHFEIFAEYKYRFTKTEIVFGIADVSVNLGIKKKILFKKIFRRLTDKYHWF